MGRSAGSSGRGRLVRDAAGRPLGMAGVNMDITDRKTAERQQALLLAELSHRVKNTLTVVRSLASRTIAGERTLDEARLLFNERLRALAAAHDQLTGSGWQGASLRALADAALGPYGGRSSLAGPDLTLGAKAALTLALVLHELATNAAKHGALAAPEGRVELGWAIEPVDGGLTLRWRERGGPSVVAPWRRGFGRTLIEQGLKHDLDGEVALEFRADGLVWSGLRAAAAGGSARRALSGSGSGSRQPLVATHPAPVDVVLQGPDPASSTVSEPREPMAQRSPVVMSER